MTGRVIFQWGSIFNVTPAIPASVTHLSVGNAVLVTTCELAVCANRYKIPLKYSEYRQSLLPSQTCLYGMQCLSLHVNWLSVQIAIKHHLNTVNTFVFSCFIIQYRRRGIEIGRLVEGRVV